MIDSKKKKLRPTKVFDETWGEIKSLQNAERERTGTEPTMAEILERGWAALKREQAASPNGSITFVPLSGSTSSDTLITQKGDEQWRKELSADLKKMLSLLKGMAVERASNRISKEPKPRSGARVKKAEAIEKKDERDRADDGANKKRSSKAGGDPGPNEEVG